MTTFFVTRHPGAVDWSAKQGIMARTITHLDPALVGPGDIVMGTLPVNVAAIVCQKGARYLHLSLDLPPEARGRELNADEMARYGACLTEYRIEKTGTP